MNAETTSLDTFLGYESSADEIVADYVDHLRSAYRASTSDGEDDVLFQLRDKLSLDNLPRRIEALNKYAEGDEACNSIYEIRDDISQFLPFCVPVSRLGCMSHDEALRLMDRKNKVVNIGVCISLPLVLCGGGSILLNYAGIIPDEYVALGAALVFSGLLVQAGSFLARKVCDAKAVSAWEELDESRIKARENLNLRMSLHKLSGALDNNRDYIVEQLGKYQRAI